MGTIIGRYILREISLPFFLMLFILTFVLIMGRILQLMDLMVNKGIGLPVILELLGCLAPSFLVLTIPISLLISILIGLGRLSGDNELIVLKSSGISLYQLIPPVAVLTVLALIVTAVTGIFLAPAGNLKTKTLLFEIAKQKASVGIKEKVFNDDFAGLILYANTIPVHGDYMEGVFISDSRLGKDPVTIIAEKGYLVSNLESMTVMLRLERGSTHSVDDAYQRYKKMEFSTYDVQLDFEETMGEGGKKLRKDEKEMTIAELREKLMDPKLKDRTRREMIIELHSRFAIPLSCIVFGILGIPLGISKHRSGKSRGFVVGIFIIMTYYVLQLSGIALGETERIPPAVGPWAPNILLGCLGIYLFFMAARERAVLPFDNLSGESFRRFMMERIMKKR